MKDLANGYLMSRGGGGGHQNAHYNPSLSMPMFPSQGPFNGSFGIHQQPVVFDQPHHNNPRSFMQHQHGHGCAQQANSDFMMNLQQQPANFVMNPQQSNTHLLMCQQVAAAKRMRVEAKRMRVEAGQNWEGRRQNFVQGFQANYMVSNAELNMGNDRGCFSGGVYGGYRKRRAEEEVMEELDLSLRL